MLYYPDALIDQWILDDVAGGDLTSRALGIGQVQGRMRFVLTRGGRASGVQAAARLLGKLGLAVTVENDDGAVCAPGAVLLHAEGRADALHMGWKPAQNILEWCSGVASYIADMLARGREENPNLHIACTRKCIPGTKILSQAAVLHGGGLMHRLGTAESILIFANHRRFLPHPGDWAAIVTQARQAAPEKTIAVEADTIKEALELLRASPDILQLDKFSPDDVATIVRSAREQGVACLVAAAGGIHKENIGEYARSGVPLIVSSAPYYAKPADVKVKLAKA